MNMEHFNVIITTRLKDNPVARLLAELDTNIRYISLRRGEFVFSGKIGVKYLTREMFLQAVKNRTIYRDIIELKREFTEPIIVIEGDARTADRADDLAAVQGAEVFISVLNRIPILATHDEMETAQLLFMLAAQVGTGLDVEPGTEDEAAALAAAETDQDSVETIVTRIPDIDPGTAKSLIRRFGSLDKLRAADVAELKKVAGIGLKRARKIHAFLNQEGVPQNSVR